MRDEALMPLTHDHHHALAAARRLGLAAKGDVEERTVRAGEFISFFRTETLQHFREEEETVFPLIVEAPEAEEVLGRVMLEHLRIHALVATLRRETDAGHPSPATMETLAELLQDHVRFEEKVVFPLIESRVDPVALRLVSLADRNRSGQTT